MMRGSPRFKAASQAKKAAPIGPRPSSKSSNQWLNSQVRNPVPIGDFDGIDAQREDAGQHAETTHRRGGEGGQALGEQRVARPDDGGADGKEIAAQVGDIQPELPAGGDNAAPRQAGERADGVVQAEFVAGQKERRQDHDQQRPQVIEQVGPRWPAQSEKR